MSFFIYKQKNNFFTKSISFFLISTFLVTVSTGISTFSTKPETASAQTNIDAAEKRLREELAKLEEQQAILEASLREQQSKTATIQRDVNILSDQIRQAELNIRRKNLEIENIKGTIELKQNTIAELNLKMERSKLILSELLRKANQISEISFSEIILTNDNLTDFFAKIDSYSNIQIQLDELFKEIKSIKAETEEETEKLSAQQRKELDLKKEIESQKSVVATKKSTQDNLLSISKNSESAYQTFIAEKRAQASAIRTALFQLRDGTGIPFGEALRYAEAASRATGVRTAFILGILKQESDIGKNVGTCVITDLSSGQTRSLNSGNVFANGIHPTRDLPLLQTIVKSLGMKPEDTRVSCPQSIGYGGAMGPSQFIPSTWNSYISKIQQAVGVYPSPWNPQHAIMATALFTKDLGAAAGGYSAEREAAGRYYAGGNWSTLGLGYANSVLAHATEFQRQIDFLAEVD
ncbi:MAG TPA: lytic murein transglycosylase [Candidatus Paceibacterota bacterium]|nr:lytic murein transglycosylase [Candidatus Paceibacterota bacterium]